MEASLYLWLQLCAYLVYELFLLAWLISLTAQICVEHLLSFY